MSTYEPHHSPSDFGRCAAPRFALARLGAVLVPINFMLKAQEVAYILRHAGARTLATDSGLAELAHCNTHMASFKSPKRVVFTDPLPKQVESSSSVNCVKVSTTSRNRVGGIDPGNDCRVK